MASRPWADPAHAAVRHMKLSDELAQIERDYERLEKHEELAFVEAKQVKAKEIEAERAKLLAGIPSGLVPESLEQFFKDKKDLEFAKLTQEFGAKKVQRQTAFKKRRDKHLQKWVNILHDEPIVSSVRAGVTLLPFLNLMVALTFVRGKS